MLFYLNDVEEGGGTAFPVAGNETLDQDVRTILVSKPSQGI